MLIYENDMGALFIVTADKPTKRMRHMDQPSVQGTRILNFLFYGTGSKKNISVLKPYALSMTWEINSLNLWTESNAMKKTDVIMGCRIPNISHHIQEQTHSLTEQPPVIPQSLECLVTL